VIKPICLHSNCKININLEITAILQNGYHELKSVFYPLARPYDLIHIDKGIKRGLTLTCTEDSIDILNNTVCKAYEYYSEYTKFSPSLNVFLEKKIPLGAGLGGGSSNAAQILLYLNSINEHKITNAELKSLGIKVGADVAFFLQKNPCLCTGIGDKLEKLPFFLRKQYIVLLCPSIHISTPWAYKMWDKFNLQKKALWDLTSLPVEAKKTLSYCKYVKNTFEEVIFTHYSELQMFKEVFIQFGARATALSGSGSSIFGLFSKEIEAQKMYDYFIKQKHRVYLQTL